MAWTVEVVEEASVAGEKWVNSGYVCGVVFVCGVVLTGFEDDLHVGMKR